jgi:antitoxin (DNA-binding transcriptional repressor) of toxin-antitoxin stability system
MTSISHMREVGIADLKARLSEHIGNVRRGSSIVVLDRSTAVARIVPMEQAADALVIRKPARRTPPLGRVRLPPRLKTRVDPVVMLLSDRASGR